MKKIFHLMIPIIISILTLFDCYEKRKLQDTDILGVYIDNEIADKIPAKGEAMFSKAVCDHDVNYYWDEEKWGLFVSNLSNKNKCNLYFVNYSDQTIFNFDYNGNEQIFNIPVSGTYKLEAWGAQGGGPTDNEGGAGSYSKGYVYLKAGTTIYINVGGMGNVSEDKINSLAVGGYNGGGNGINQVNLCGNFVTGSGGGATHIALKSGTINNLENKIDDILIVAGGGGGGNFCNTQNHGHGGDAGGVAGNAAYNLGTDANNNSYGLGGTQKSYGCSSQNENCGTFGNGFSTNIYGVGAGGGFYGGGGSQLNGAGGGSGYIGNSLLTNKVMYCYNCLESNNKEEKTISTTCNEETPTNNCAKKGNGYDRITLVSVDN